MKPRHVILIVVAMLLGGGLVLRTATGQMGKGYYRVLPDDRTATLSAAEAAYLLGDARTASSVRSSVVRTMGIWLAAFFTLAIFSFLYRDNPLFRVAEHAFVGVSAAYWMVVAFWAAAVPNLLAPLFPRWVKLHLLPGLELAGGGSDVSVAALVQPWWELSDPAFIFPLALGVLLLWRLAPVGNCIARWPLAYIVGTTAGLRLVRHIETDFLAQIANTILPLAVLHYDASGGIDVLDTALHSLRNVMIVAGVCCVLVYFFFSLEHKGPIGGAARVGVWLLMITFGAGFGYTVMARVALLVGRVEFLLQDWLNLTSY